MLVACAAHWYESLLFVAPVAFVAGALKWGSWKADREAASLEAPPEVAHEVA